MGEVRTSMIPPAEIVGTSLELGQPSDMQGSPKPLPAQERSVQEAADAVFEQIGEQPSQQDTLLSIHASLTATAPQESVQGVPTESLTWTQRAHEVYMCVIRALENIIQQIGDGIESASELPRKLFDRVKVSFEEIRPFIREVAERIYQIVLPLFQILMTVLLFAGQSTLFTVGFLTGILSPGAIQNATQRICNVWNRQHGLAKGLIVTGAIVAWPIALAASAFFVGGNLGVFCQSPDAEQPVGVV